MTAESATPSSHPERTVDENITLAMRNTVFTHGHTPTDMAHVIGMTEPTMSRRQSFGGWTVDEADRMAKALSVGLDDLAAGLEGFVAMKADMVAFAKKLDAVKREKVAPLSDTKRVPDSIKDSKRTPTAIRRSKVRREGIEPPTRWLSETPGHSATIIAFPTDRTRPADRDPHLADVITLPSVRTLEQALVPAPVPAMTETR